MIKEFFEIEPSHKNMLIIFLAFVGVSMVQILIYYPTILNDSPWIWIFVLFSIATSHMIINLIPGFFYYTYKVNTLKEDLTIKYRSRHVFLIGYFELFWVLAATYVAYELKFSSPLLIRILIGFAIARTLLWIILITFRPAKEEQSKQ